MKFDFEYVQSHGFMLHIHGGKLVCFILFEIRFFLQIAICL